jgi:hypothetical protein
MPMKFVLSSLPETTMREFREIVTEHLGWI